MLVAFCKPTSGNVTLFCKESRDPHNALNRYAGYGYDIYVRLNKLTLPGEVQVIIQQGIALIPVVFPPQVL